MFQNIPVQIKAELEGSLIAKDHHFLLLYYTIYIIYTHTHIYTDLKDFPKVQTQETSLLSKLYSHLFWSWVFTLIFFDRFI